MRRRYRIESTKATLKRLLEELLKLSPTGSFVQKVTSDVNEEYYYVVVIADQKVHDELKKLPYFKDSIPLKPQS